MIVTNILWLFWVNSSLLFHTVGSWQYDWFDIICVHSFTLYFFIYCMIFFVVTICVLCHDGNKGFTYLLASNFYALGFSQWQSHPFNVTYRWPTEPRNIDERKLLLVHEVFDFPTQLGSVQSSGSEMATPRMVTNEIHCPSAYKSILQQY